MQQTQVRVKKNILAKGNKLKISEYHLLPRMLPKTLTAAAGLLKGKFKKTPLAYQKTLREEW